MKKISLLFTVIMLVMLLYGCINVSDIKLPTNEIPRDAVQTDASPADTAPENNETDKASPDEKEGTAKSENTEAPKNEVPAVEFLTLSKCQRFIQEWGEDEPYIEVEWENIRLSDSDAQKYPALSAYFEQLNILEDDMALNTSNDYRSSYVENPWSRLYSHSEYFVLRADDVIVSIRQDGESYTGGAHGYYSSYGINIHPKTAEEVTLNDVIKDKQALYKLIFDSVIASHPEEIYEENRQEMYKSFEENGLNWTMDYDKLTVYFNPYLIASYAAGLIKVDVWFDEHPELFNEKYIASPSSYAIELAHFEPYTFGNHDTVSVGSYEDEDYYTVGELVIGINGNEYRESEMYGASLTPFLVCVDGKYYIYAEIGEFNGANSIHIYSISNNEVKKIGKVDVGFKKLWDYTMIDFGGYYREIINNPENMNLETYFWLLDTSNTAYRSYAANKKTGIPESDKKVYKVNEDNYKKITLRDIDAKSIESGKTETLPAGTVLTLTTTDCTSYINAVTDDGKEYRIDIKVNDIINTIGGVDVIDCFTDMMPDYGFDETDEVNYERDAQILVPYTLYEEEYVNEDGMLSAASKIELIQLAADENNTAVNTINGEINQLYQDYLYNYGYSDTEWCYFLAWPTATDRYLNAVITHIAYPTYGTNGKVSSWVYDKETGKQYTLDEALADAGITRAGLLAEFNDAVSYWGGKAVEIDSLALRMLPDGKPQFLAGVKLQYSPEDTWVHFMTRTEDGIANWDNVPFDPADVTGDFSGEPLFCQTEYANAMDTE